MDTRALYRHRDAALLRAAAAPLNDIPEWWPELADPNLCRSWLREMWARPGVADAVRHASAGLADRVDAVNNDEAVSVKQLRRATFSVIRYWLRAVGRPTPFGLFAGVARVAIGPRTQVDWRDDHRVLARVTTEGLADLITRMEDCPELLERLCVTFNNLAIRRGNRLQVPHGPNRVTIRYTTFAAAVHDASLAPVQVGVLADKLTAAFGDGMKVRQALAELVRQGFLITCLRAPFTEVDPLAHLVNRLHAKHADDIKSVAPLLRELESIQTQLHAHNRCAASPFERARLRNTLTGRIRDLSSAGRTALAVDLLLNCRVRLPHHVIAELERAADALVRLTRQPTGQPVWRDFHAAFRERYGTGTLVPVAEVVDPDAGLGYPAGYPGSTAPSPPAAAVTERHARLLSLAWQAVADGSREIVLTESIIDDVTAKDRFDKRRIPPHVELAARIHATSTQALDRGDYTLVVAPARAAGTLTARFTPLATGSGLEKVYRDLPTGTEGALPVQMSFPPLYPHAENICRIPAYLPHVLALGEHRIHDDAEVISLDDLAVTATVDRLHLVSVSHRCVIEPQVLHALALEKQPPPLARFLAHLPRAFTADWHDFDWGPHAQQLPYLPRVRYGRAILCPARWQLTSQDLPSAEAGADEWRRALRRWRHRWQMPGVVELRDADRTLRITLDEPAHTAVVRARLDRDGHAVFIETAGTATEFGWLNGHAHEIAVPLVAAVAPAPCPLAGPLPQLANGTHGDLPGSSDARWLSAKLHTHPERHDELITEHLPELVAALDHEPLYWFVRYRSPHEPDHLRLRIHVPDSEQHAMHLRAVGDWAQQLRRDGVIARLVLDPYTPEVGRYGHGPAMHAAETVFAADSRAVTASLRHQADLGIPRVALTAVNMLDIAHALLGDRDAAAAWLISRPNPAAPPADRGLADQAITLARRGPLTHEDLPAELIDAGRARAVALAGYRRLLPPDTDSVLESLLHMHHNRAIGIDPATEMTTRRLARQAALAWRARHRRQRP